MYNAARDPIRHLAHKIWRIVYFPIATMALLAANHSHQAKY